MATRDLFSAEAERPEVVEPAELEARRGAIAAVNTRPARVVQAGMLIGDLRVGSNRRPEPPAMKPSFAIYARCAPLPTVGLDLDAETVVFSNGHGFPAHTVDDLLRLLQTAPLAWSEVEVCAGGVAVTGNFEHFSHVFNVYTQDQVLAAKLMTALKDGK